MKLSFVIPVFNEVDSLDQLHDEIVAQVKEESYEIIFVDDGSTDGSVDVLRNLANGNPCVTVVVFRRNFGKSAALQKGFELATGDIVFTMDADLQDNPVEIPRFIQKIQEGWDVVTGWKKVRRDPISKRLPSKIFNSVTSRGTGLKLHDYNCGFKAFRKDVIRELDIYGELHRYIPVLAHARGFSVTEIPVDHRPRTFGKSKYGAERYLRGFLDFLTVRLVTHYHLSPLYLFGRMGALMMAAGLAINVYLTVLKLGFDQSLSNRPLLLLGLLLMILGMNLFSIGLIGELIVWKTRSQNRERQVSIREIIRPGEPDEI